MFKIASRRAYRRGTHLLDATIGRDAGLLLLLLLPAHGHGSHEVAMELGFQLSGVSFEECEAFLLITLIYFLVHGFFLNNLLGDLESLAGTLLMENRGSVCRFESCIETAIFAPRGGYKCTGIVSIEPQSRRK